ncbi:MAG TPA: ethanolamine utilization protein EutN [Calditrichaeota bacterium]|nr:ethanolamine utilization protein EutN [Calditrichota bacterium]
MLLGKVIGQVWATRKDEKLTGFKLLVVRHVELDYSPKKTYVVAADTVGAGVGEIVLITTGSSARQSVLTEGKPVDAVVSAIIDKLDIEEKV